MANLGNFSNRSLKFVAGAQFQNVIPGYPTSQLHDDDISFIDSLLSKFNDYIELLEKVKLKEGIKTAMAYSHLCNVYF